MRRPRRRSSDRSLRRSGVVAAGERIRRIDFHRRRLLVIDRDGRLRFGFRDRLQIGKAADDAVTRAAERILSAHLLFDELVAPDVERHCQSTPDVNIGNLAQLTGFFWQNTAVFPDSKQTLKRMVAEDNWVGVWGAYEGTQCEPIGPLVATNARTNFDFGAMFRMADGKIAEWWITWDNLTILQQLGHMPKG